jgi:hypothetical protein
MYKTMCIVYILKIFSSNVFIFREAVRIVAIGPLPPKLFSGSVYKYILTD